MQRETNHRPGRLVDALALRGRRRSGMSLVEVMVVITIIVTLMGILGYGVMSMFNESKVDTTMLQMRKVAERVDVYMLRKKKPPTTGEGLGTVFGDEKPPQDSWGNDFKYQSPGPSGSPYEIISYGADGKEGGSGTNEDIKWSSIK